MQADFNKAGVRIRDFTKRYTSRDLQANPKMKGAFRSEVEGEVELAGCVDLDGQVAGRRDPVAVGPDPEDARADLGGAGAVAEDEPRRRGRATRHHRRPDRGSRALEVGDEAREEALHSAGADGGACGFLGREGRAA